MADAAPPVSVLARIGNGVLLPVALFVGWQFLLIETTRGSGSWAGMMVFYVSLALVPALLVLNLWVLGVRWRGHFRVLFAGLALPVFVGLLELLALHGSTSQQRALDRFVDHPLAPLLPILLCAPLIAAIVHAILRRRA